MTLHVHGTIVTHVGIAANNRGETEGNLTTLQKILWKGDIHTTVSAEAIRFALRYQWQQAYDTTGDMRYTLNRRYDYERNDFVWSDPQWTSWAKPDGVTFIDDDVLGFMKAEAAKSDGSDSSQPAGKKAKGKTTARRGVLEISRALSLSPFLGEVTFNAMAGTKGKTSLYSTEVHSTAYQYSFSLTPARLRVRERAVLALEGLVGLGEVGGNQSRFLFDFSPDIFLCRLTQDPAPRILYPFTVEDNGEYGCEKLIQRVESGDVGPEELVLGGSVAQQPMGKRFADLGVQVEPGVKAALDCVLARIGGGQQ